MPSDSMDNNYLLGKFDPAKDTQFVAIKGLNVQGGAVGAYLRKETWAAFQTMSAAAEKDGVKLIVISATRPFDRQKQIWEDKWTGRRLVGGKNLAQAIPDPAARATEIMRFSAMPGASRHHWGTDMDLNSLENAYFATPSGKKIYDWLVAHGSEYGFCQVYSKLGPDRPFGYQEEKWHWSYLPIAKGLLDAYKNQIDYRMITGFSGSETAEVLQVIDRYVAGIAPGCLNP